MTRLHPQDLRAIVAAAISWDSYDTAGAITQADALLAELERTAKPEPQAAPSEISGADSFIQQKIRNAGFVGIDTMIQCLDARGRRIAELERELEGEKEGHEAWEQQALKDEAALRARVAELEAELESLRELECGLNDDWREMRDERDAIRAQNAELRKAMLRLFDHAADVRGYADGWEWKYGEAWDEEMDAARAALEPKEVE